MAALETAPARRTVPSIQLWLTGQGYLLVSQGLSVPQQLIHLRGGEEGSGLPAGQASSLR